MQFSRATTGLCYGQPVFSALERTFLGAALLATSSLGLLSGACSEQSDSRAGTTPSASVAVAAPSASAQPTPPPKPEPKRPYNVLFIMIDSLRADMPWAGYERPIAPKLTALEKESVS